MIYDESVIDDNAVDIQTRACTSCRFKSREISWSGGLFEKLEKINDTTSTQVILIWGEFDVTGDPAVLAEIALMRFPHFRTRVMFEAGHWIQYEKAYEINELLLEWLNLPDSKIT
jgi:pimeloyl-ACP methyl ester carboxylesterase